MTISPLAPEAAAEPPPVAGVRLAVGATGVRYQGRADLLLVDLAEGTQIAGVFTTSRVVAAPVRACRENLKRGTARALVANAGNANAFTGKEGAKSVERIAGVAARLVSCDASEVFTASTGVIGEKLPDAKITEALPALAKAVAPRGWKDAARAIMTTDTYPKIATRAARIENTPVAITGIAKGSGMIAPNMATLLAFVFTDALVPAPLLQEMLAEGNGRAFNSITVDGDESTNDTLLAFATGKAGNPTFKTATDAGWSEFREALEGVLTDLAVLVVKDGEGARKFVTIEVSGAEDGRAAHAVGLAVANSPLVKTAIAGEDANWGRIVAAAGRSGARVEEERIAVSIGGVLVAAEGARVADYDETPVAQHMKGNDIRIALDLGVGKGSATVYTCDLTHGYIDINGSYRS